MGASHDGTRGAEKVVLDDGQALAALGTAGSKNFAAALGLGTGAETNLTGALFAMRTEGGLHGMGLIKS